MKNAKFNIICALFGFFLSFILGLIARVSLGHVLLRAVIFACVCAAVSVGLQFLVKSIMSSTDDQSDSAAGGVTKSGSVVNIVLPDEELASESDAPNFFVGNNHQMLKESDYMHSVEQDDAQAVSFASALNANQSAQSSQMAVEESNFGASEQEMELKEAIVGTAAPNQSGFQAASLQSVAKSAPNSGGGSAAESLPNMGEFNVSDGKEETEEPEPAQTNEKKPAFPGKKAKLPEMNDKDTVLMAKAISTVLSGDN